MRAIKFQRRFGFEIESLISKTQRCSTFSDVLNTMNLDSSWNLIDDRTIETETHNKHISNSVMKCELISPILHYDSFTLSQIQSICDTLTHKMNANTNHSCGFHVHFDAEDLSINDVIKIAINYSYFENIIDLFMHKTRRGNGNKYIQSIKEPITNNFDNLFDILESENKANYTKTNLSILHMLNPKRKLHKYHFANLFYYNLSQIGFNNKQHRKQYVNTIENRHHESTLNYDDVLQWIKFNLLFIHQSQNKPVFLLTQKKTDADNFTRLAQFIEDDDVMSFYERKISQTS